MSTVYVACFCNYEELEPLVASGDLDRAKRFCLDHARTAQAEGNGTELPTKWRTDQTSGLARTADMPVAWTNWYAVYQLEVLE